MVADSKLGEICLRCGTALRNGGGFCPDCGFNHEATDAKIDAGSSSKRIVVEPKRGRASSVSASRVRGRKSSTASREARRPLEWTSLGADGAPNFVIATIFISAVVTGIFLLAFLLR
jgi:uncharacterized Zn finger protein (UPF0148 family)